MEVTKKKTLVASVRNNLISQIIIRPHSHYFELSDAFRQREAASIVFNANQAQWQQFMNAFSALHHAFCGGSTFSI